jgi:hypothetical protein
MTWLGLESGISTCRHLAAAPVAQLLMGHLFTKQ